MGLEKSVGDNPYDPPTLKSEGDMSPRPQPIDAHGGYALLVAQRPLDVTSTKSTMNTWKVYLKTLNQLCLQPLLESKHTLTKQQCITTFVGEHYSYEKN